MFMTVRWSMYESCYERVTGLYKISRLLSDGCWPRVIVRTQDRAVDACDLLLVTAGQSM